MKKLLPLSFIFNIVFIAIAVLMITGPIIGGTFSKINSSLSSVGGSAPQEIDYYDVMPVAEALPPLVAPESGVVDQSIVTNASGNPAAQVERIVIKNANLAIVVKDVEGRKKNIEVMAEQMGGFVVSSDSRQNQINNVDVPEAQVTIRVPAEKLEEALEQIKKDVVEVQSETVSGQDVTSEYVDLQSRLKNLQAAETQFEEILKNATETEDVVNVFNQLVYYREQIELIKGQIKYYDEAAALSSVSVYIIAEETIQPIMIGKWEPKGVALEAIQDLVDFLQGFSDFLIRFVIYVLPASLIVGFFLYLTFKGGRVIYRKMQTNKPNAEDIEETSVEKK